MPAHDPIPHPARRGRFITIEGPDGSGKTLQAERLGAALRARGRAVVVTREPGGTRVGDQIRHVLLDPANHPIAPAADSLLFNAARAQHCAEVIEPALAAGRDVLCARYADSTLAYQGYGSGLPIAELRAVIAHATRRLVPDRTILLDVPAEVGLARKSVEENLRFEAAFDLDFHRRVRDGYLALAAEEPGRFTVVDAARDADAVFADVLAAALEVLEGA